MIEKKTSMARFWLNVLFLALIVTVLLWCGNNRAILVEKSVLAHKAWLRLGLTCVVITTGVLVLWYRSLTKARVRKRSGMIAAVSPFEKGYILACFILYFCWSASFLYWDRYGPDEVMRYSILKYIFEHRVLPTGLEKELINPIWGFSYALNLSIPNLIAPAFMWIVSLYTQSPEALLIAARFVSVLSMTGVVWLTMQIAAKLRLGRSRWFVILLMSVTPQISFLASYVNPDSFALFVVMLIMDSWIDGLRSEWSRPARIKLGLSMGMCFLSYSFAYSFLAGSLLLYLFWWIRNRKTVPFQRFLLIGLEMLAYTFLICGWWMIRNAVLHQGDFLSSLATRSRMAEQYAIPEMKPSVYPTARKQGIPIYRVPGSREWGKYTAKSVFFGLGYMDIFAAPWLYGGYQLFLAAGWALALLISMASVRNRERRKASVRGQVLLFGMISGAISLCLSIYYSWAIDWQCQGRYVIYALPAVGLLAAVGYEKLFDMLRKRWPVSAPMLQKGAIAVFTAFSAAAQATGLLACVERFLGGNATGWP